MRICSKCSLARQESEFYWRNKKLGRLHAQCKSCYKEQRLTFQATHYKTYQANYQKRAIKRREMLRKEYRDGMIKYLSGKYCSDCKESDIRVLELDHINPVEKSFSISQAVRLGYRWEKVAEELKKCQILCANCHKKRTAEQFGWYKNI